MEVSILVKYTSLTYDLRSTESMISVLQERGIKGTKILAEIKRMLSRVKDQTWKTDTHNKEH